MSDYYIINANETEKEIINNIIKYIQHCYSHKLKIESLNGIEVVDKLSGGASGRAFRDKMFLARENGLNVLKYKNYNKPGIILDDELKDVISTIYHELWHISTWKKYEYMYESVLNDNIDDITAYAYMYWIEYIGHLETVFMEVPKKAQEFCQSFSCAKWEKDQSHYIYFVKSLPYYLARSQYLGIFEELTIKIECKELKEAVYEFDYTSKQLLGNEYMDDIQKANIIKEKINKLLD